MAFLLRYLMKWSAVLEEWESPIAGAYDTLILCVQDTFEVQAIAHSKQKACNAKCVAIMCQGKKNQLQ